jgi:hypothetical protein
MRVIFTFLILKTTYFMFFILLYYNTMIWIVNIIYILISNKYLSNINTSKSVYYKFNINICFNFKYTTSYTYNIRKTIALNSNLPLFYQSICNYNKHKQHYIRYMSSKYFRFHQTKYQHKIH